MNTPQRLAPDAGRKDTFFEKAPPDVAGLDARAVRPAFGDPRLRWVGHYDGTPPQAEALRLDDPARGRESAGMDTALVVYSGISVKMLVDRVFGADLLTMFTVDYEPGGSAQQHDHPFEEAYFFLAGEVEAELDGEVYTFAAGRRGVRRRRRRARLLQQRHRAACAGSRPRRRSRRRATPTAGCRAWKQFEEDYDGRMTERSSSSAARGRSGWSSSGTTRRRVGEVVLTGQSPENVDAAVAESRAWRRRRSAASRSTSPSRTRSPAPSPTSGPSTAWRSPRSTATRTPSPTTTSTARSGS